MPLKSFLRYAVRACAPVVVLLPIGVVISLMPQAESTAAHPFLSYIPMIAAAVLSVIVRIAYSLGITAALLRKSSSLETARLQIVLRVFIAPLISVGSVMFCGPMFLGPWGIGLLLISPFLLIPAVLIPLPHTVASAAILRRSGEITTVTAVLMVLCAPLAITSILISVLAFKKVRSSAHPEENPIVSDQKTVL